MEFRILGPVGVFNGSPVAIKGRRRVSLLARLLVDAGQTVSRDRIIDDVWEEGALPTLATLHSHVSQLRKLLGADRLVNDGDGYRLIADPAQIDASVFLAEVAAARSSLQAGPAEPALETVTAALSRWRGPALDGVDRPWARDEAARLEAEREVAEELHLEALVTLGRHDEAVLDGERLVADSPLRERRWELLMLSLYRSGRQAEALRAHDRLHATLVEELGITPSPEIESLHHRILGHDPQLLEGASTPRIVGPPPTDGGPIKAAGSPLPASRSSFVGRGEELAAIGGHVRRHRLVTLVGQGGVGKTRLATEVSRELSGAETTWFVDLAAVADDDHVADAFVAALPMVSTRGVRPLDQLVGYLHDRPARLLVDNCEHVIAGAAAVVDQLLTAAPKVSVLATSRETLGVEGEFVVRLGGLTDGSSGPNAAVDLFLDRATATGQPVADEPGARQVVNEICLLLEGVPLAIELAAARTVLLPLVEIRARLDDRLSLLDVDGRRGARRSVVGTLDWSFDLLEAPEQDAFQTLSVFPTSFGIEDATAVLGVSEGDALGLVDSLVRKSLVDSDPAAPRPYRLPETIRQYAFAKLEAAGQTGAARDRHAQWLGGRLAPFAGHLSEIRWLDEAHPDVVAACTWATESDQPGLLAQVCFGALSHWTVRSTYHQGRRWIDEALSRPLEGHLHSAMLLGRGLLDMLAIDFDSWRVMSSLVDDLAAKVHEPDLFLAAAVAQAGYIRVVDDPDEAIRVLDSCFDLLPPPEIWAFPQMLVRGLRAHALVQAGRLDDMAVDVDAIDAWETALDDPHPRLRHIVQVCRTIGALLQGDHERARAIDLEPVDPDSLWAISLRVLEAIVVAHDNPAEAARRLVQLADDLGAVALVATDDLLLLGFLAVHIEQGDLDRAQVLLDSLGAIREPALTALAEHYLARLQPGDAAEVEEAVGVFRSRRLESGWLEAVAPTQRELLRAEVAAAR